MGCTRQIYIYAHHSETRYSENGRICIKWDKKAWATTAISISIKFNWNWNADWWRHQRAKCANTILVIHIYCAIYFPFICCAHGFLSLIKTFSAIAELWLSFSLSPSFYSMFMHTISFECAACVCCSCSEIQFECAEVVESHSLLILQ
mgnify:CR=1 FL=1